MNRRDTIIIAVLLNAALLAILFMMAVRHEDPTDEFHNAPQIVMDATKQSTPSSQELINSPSDASISSTPTGDEIDNVLKHYADSPHLILVEEEGELGDKELSASLPTDRSESRQISPLETSTQPSQLVTITVKKGDALEKIARANNTSVEAIKKANHLTSNRLNIGQLLKVPVGTKKNNLDHGQQKPLVSKETTLITPAGPELYTIKSGDNPWKIAKQFNVKFDDLLKMNNLDEEKARNLQVGDRIRVK